VSFEFCDEHRSDIVIPFSDFVGWQGEPYSSHSYQAFDPSFEEESLHPTDSLGQSRYSEKVSVGKPAHFVFP
jgi:hypothetical protein